MIGSPIRYETRGFLIRIARYWRRLGNIQLFRYRMMSRLSARSYSDSALTDYMGDLSEEPFKPDTQAKLPTSFQHHREPKKKAR